MNATPERKRMMTEASEQAALCSSGLLAVLRRHAEAHRKMLLRLADDGHNEPKQDLQDRATAVFDLIEILSAAEKESTANAEVSHAAGEQGGI